MGVIYLVRCTSSGKSYVGQTTHGVAHRLDEHLRITARKGYAFGAAIRKYGRDAFRISELERCDTRDDLDVAERFWIDWYGTISPGGYNLASGGRAFRHSPETRAKMSEIALTRSASSDWGARISNGKRASNYTHSSDTRAKIAATSKGRSAPNKGTTMSDAQRAKLRAAWVIRKARVAS